MALQTIWQAVAGRLRSKLSSVNDGVQTNVIADPYGVIRVLPLGVSDHGAADEGSYFVGSAGVAGSSSAIPLGPASAVPADTTPFFLMQNTAPVGGPNLWLKRVYALLSSAQTSETGLDIQGQLDSGLLYTSGGTKLTMANQNPLGPGSFAMAVQGNITKAAKTQLVIFCARSKPRTTIPIAGDEYIWKAGATEGPSSFITSTAGAVRQVIDLGAIVIPPQWTFSLHAAFGATSTGTPAMEIETGHIER